MPDADRQRILIVDDEEAILETMGFTFEDEYEVLTASSAPRGLELLERSGPVAAVISDQRMAEMSGVEFLTEVFRRHPETTRIILTGFADMDAIIQAINAGHVYAYITKPWEHEALKQVVHRAVDHHRLIVENERLMADLRESAAFLEAVMDHLDTGAIAVDAAGVVRAANRPALRYLGLEGDLRARTLRGVLEEVGGPSLADSVDKLCGDPEACFEEFDLQAESQPRRLRIHAQALEGASGEGLGRVLLLREISHEPLRRRFDELLSGLSNGGDSLRPGIETTLSQLRELRSEIQETRIESPGMAEQRERISRALTALDHWVAVDDALAGESYPDAQLLRERLRVATDRWPLADQLPEQVLELGRCVEAYYETGENPRRSVL
ncbi:MAG: response regulator [Myxococcota bacterium]